MRKCSWLVALVEHSVLLECPACCGCNLNSNPSSTWGWWVVNNVLCDAALPITNVPAAGTSSATCGRTWALRAAPSASGGGHAGQQSASQRQQQLAAAAAVVAAAAAEAGVAAGAVAGEVAVGEADLVASGTSRDRPLQHCC